MHFLFRPYGGMRFSIGTPGESALITNLQIASTPDDRQGLGAFGLLVGQLGYKIGNNI